MIGKYIFTSKDHLLCESEIFSCNGVPGATNLKVHGDKTNGFLGFGVAITPSSCYELSQMESAARKELLEKIYTKKGIGLSVARLCVGSCDYSPEIYSYDEVENDIDLEHFSIEKDEEYIIPIIKEIIEINPDIYFFASPWSPPYWMKTGGSMCGGYMRAEYIECYAEYYIKFIEAYAEHGIKISAITPQNETNTQQNSRMPACIWHPEIEAEFVKVLRKKFEERGMDIKIWIYDHNFDDIHRVMWQLEKIEGLAQACDGVAFHYYGGTVEESAKVKRAFKNLGLHFTEGGPRLTENYSTDKCKWGTIISRALSNGYSSFTGWNLMLNELGGPNVGPYLGTCGGLVTRDTRSGELTYSGQYYAFAHIAPYITEDSDIYPITVDEDFGQSPSRFTSVRREVEGIAIDNHDGKIVAILNNPTATALQTTINIGGKTWYIELAADSIATIIV